MDVLRAALGEQVMTYYGASYGTQLGSTYAELFPERVGRLVLDGAVDPTLTVREEALTQAGGFETALQRLRRRTASTRPTPASSAATSTRGCNASATSSTEVDAEPLAVGDRDLTVGLAVYGILMPLYNRDYWILLSQGLQVGLRRRRLGAASARRPRTPRGTPTAGYTDNPWRRSPRSAASTTRRGSSPRRCPARSPEFEEASPTFGRIYAWGLVSLPQLAARPAASTPSRSPSTPQGAAPIVVVGTTRDPATPYAWAEALAAQLDSGRPGHPRWRRPHRLQLRQRVHQRGRRVLPHRGRGPAGRAVLLTSRGAGDDPRTPPAPASHGRCSCQPVAQHPPHRPRSEAARRACRPGG